jgi:hypothetical protein
LFCDKKPKGKFLLSPTIEVIGFYTLKTYINKNAKSTSVEEGTKHKKSKEIEVEKSKVTKEAKEVCNSS